MSDYGIDYAHDDDTTYDVRAYLCDVPQCAEEWRSVTIDGAYLCDTHYDAVRGTATAAHRSK